MKGAATHGRRRSSGSAIRVAVATTRPAAAAARPAIAACAWGGAARRAERAGAAITTPPGAPIKPALAASDPRQPAARAPTTIERFTTLGPGRLWHRARVSL